MLKVLPLLQAPVDVWVKQKIRGRLEPREHCIKSLMYRAIATVPGHKCMKKK